MNIKQVFAVLLMLCGTGLLSTAHAADFRCLVYSGADGSKLEKTSTADGAYAISAADLKAAEAGALKKGAQYKKGVVLTRAECTPAAGPSPAASAPATPTAPVAPAAAPTSSGKTFYCMVYAADSGQQLKPPAAHAAQGNAWNVTAAEYSGAEAAGVALAKASGFADADSAECGSSIESLMGNY